MKHGTVTAHGSSLSQNVLQGHLNNILVCESEKRETKPITNKELHRRDPLVGNGITQPFNWMGLTFAEQGVTAFARVQRPNLLPYRCITLQ